MSRFSIALIRLATLALLGSAGTAVYAQQTIDQNKALAGNVTPGDAPGFPITLSVPGHYRLMGNLNVPAGVTSAVSITAAGVTLDLNGFQIAGPVKCFQGGEATAVTCSPAAGGPLGIQAGGYTGIRVRNGVIRGFDTYGMTLGQAGLAEQLHIEQIAGSGITGQFIQVRDVSVQLSRDEGINLGSYGVVDRSVTRFNGGIGIIAGMVQNSQSFGNRKGGMVGRLGGNWASSNGVANFGGTSISMGGNVNGDTPF